MIDLYNAAMLALVEEKHKSNYARISAKNNTRKLCILTRKSHLAL